MSGAHAQPMLLLLSQSAPLLAQLEMSPLVWMLLDVCC